VSDPADQTAICGLGQKRSGCVKALRITLMSIYSV